MELGLVISFYGGTVGTYIIFTGGGRGGKRGHGPPWVLKKPLLLLGFSLKNKNFILVFAH